MCKRFVQFQKLKFRLYHKSGILIIVKVRDELESTCRMLQYHTREPIVFKDLVTKIETEMRKLDRLCKQVGNIPESDDRFIRGLQRITSSILQDAKFEMISRKSEMDGIKISKSSSEKSSPYSSFPSTPQRNITPERAASPRLVASRNLVKLNRPPEVAKVQVLTQLTESKSLFEPRQNSVDKNPFGESFDSEEKNTNPFGNVANEDENENYDDSKNPFSDKSSTKSEKTGKLLISEECADIFHQDCFYFSENILNDINFCMS